MTNPQPAPPWKHWWIWCLGCIALGSLLLVDYAQRQEGEVPGGGEIASHDGENSPADESKSAIGGPIAAVSPSGPTDVRPRDTALTTGDSQIDAFVRDELR